MRTSKANILLLSLLMLGWLTACSNSAPASNRANDQLSPPDRVEVVYFYDSKICQCEKLPGEHIQSTLFINFSSELASGKLTYQMVDLNDRNNTAIASQYGATSLSLFLKVVRADDQQIVAVPEILLVKDDYDALDRLVNNRISEYLYGQSNSW